MNVTEEIKKSFVITCKKCGSDEVEIKAINYPDDDSELEIQCKGCGELADILF